MWPIFFFFLFNCNSLLFLFICLIFLNFSAAIELSGQLSVDAYIVESGVKVYGNIHTATGSDVSVRFIDGLGIDVKLGLPVKKQDVVSFNSNIVTIFKEKGHLKLQAPVKFDTKRYVLNWLFINCNIFTKYFCISLLWAEKDLGIVHLYLSSCCLTLIDAHSRVENHFSFLVVSFGVGITCLEGAMI